MKQSHALFLSCFALKRSLFFFFFFFFFKEVDVLKSLVIYVLTKNNHYMLIMAFGFGFLSQLIFTVKSVDQDVLCITVFDRDLFSPNGKCYSPYPLTCCAFTRHSL